VTHELLTFGHGTASADELLALLQGSGVAAVVDVRIGPGSRRHPHVARTELADWLPAGGVGYRWARRLGGFRKPAPDSPDVALRNASFAAYAAHMRTPDFLLAVEELLTGAAATRTAIMCSESLWWRCHRRLIAGYVVLARAVPVRHLMHDGRMVEHPPTPGVRLGADRLLVYADLVAAGHASREHAAGPEARQ
jgi:uncharacterized protein (DUF488 family)